VKQVSLTFFEHLDELRKRLLICAGALLGGTALAYLYADPLLEWLISPIQGRIGEFYFFSPAEGFMIKIKTAFLAALVLTSPVILSQIWLFVAPALHGKEKRLMLPLALVTSLLFVSGALFCFYWVVPTALEFLIGMETVFLKPMISMTEYLGFLSMMLLAFGIAFNMPVFVMAFVGMGWVDARGLNRYQKQAIVLIFILAAILTPGPDIASQLLLAAPLLVLFELSVAAAKVVEMIRSKKQGKSG
jgi:sec-independent protein translocase protein TatC